MRSNPVNSQQRAITFYPSPRILSADWWPRLRSAPLIAWLVVISLLIYGATRDPTLSGWAWTVGVIGALFVVPNVVARINARIWMRGGELNRPGNGGGSLAWRIGSHGRDQTPGTAAVPTRAA